MCVKSSENKKEAPVNDTTSKESQKLNYLQIIKYHLSRPYAFYFNIRYLNIIFTLNSLWPYQNIKKGYIYKNSLREFGCGRTSLMFEDSKLEELFELADKAEYLAASMLEIDLAELNPTDNFKENYTFTVIIENFCYKNLF